MESAVSGLAFRKVHGLFSPALLPDRLAARIAASGADIVHLHWVARMMQLETLAAIETPLVWTLHDSWPFTGGCFLPGDCTRYEDNCGQCPILASDREEDLSRRVWRRKQRAWERVDLTLVAPSRWMGKRARASSLFAERRIEVIPNGLDTERFRPLDKDAARAELGLPLKKKLILFGAKGATSDRNKGFHLLLAAFRDIAAHGFGEEVELVVFGASDQEPPPGFDLRCHFLGWQNSDDTLARLYSAADLFILPSLQENLPYAVMEAMACGTPCVAFDTGGLSDLIDHDATGYLARPFDASDLARGIVRLLRDPELREEMGAACRDKVTREFAIDKVAGRHMRLYEELLERGSGAASPDLDQP